MTIHLTPNNLLSQTNKQTHLSQHHGKITKPPLVTKNKCEGHYLTYNATHCTAHTLPDQGPFNSERKKNTVETSESR